MHKIPVTDPRYWYSAKLQRVIDGDTIVVSIDLGLSITAEHVTLRLAGIDAPELRTEEGQDSKRHLIAIMPAQVLLKTIKPPRGTADRRGKYGRLLASVFTLDGRSINQQMIDDGFAAPYD